MSQIAFQNGLLCGMATRGLVRGGTGAWWVRLVELYPKGVPAQTLHLDFLIPRPKAGADNYWSVLTPRPPLLENKEARVGGVLSVELTGYPTQIVTLDEVMKSSAGILFMELQSLGADLIRLPAH